MHPVLFTLFGHPIHAYFAFLPLALLSAMFLAAWRAPAAGIPREPFMSMEIAIFVAALVGSRVAFILEVPAYYAAHPGEMLNVLNLGGVSFFGGLVFGAGAGLAYIAWAGLPLGRVCDLSAPYIALGHAVGKVGCFLHGCCYGKPTDVSWGMCFPNFSGDTLPRHPAQLYEMAGLIALFFALCALRRLDVAAGTVMGAYLIGYGALRFALEYSRDASQTGPAYLGLFRYQWASAIAMAGGAALVARVRAVRG